MAGGGRSDAGRVAAPATEMPVSGGFQELADPCGAPEESVSACSMPAAMRCRHCHAADVWRWGSADNGRQRWRCRDCCRTFSANTGTVLEGLRKPDLFARLVADMATPQPLSCRGLAGQMGVDRMTVWHWRRKAMELIGRSCPPVEPVTMVVRESRKASREWVNHRRDPERYPEPDRLRWHDYPRLGIAAPDWLERYRVNLVAAVDPFGKCRAAILPSPCTDGLGETAIGNGDGSPEKCHVAEVGARVLDRPALPGGAGAAMGGCVVRREVEADLRAGEAVAARPLRLGLRQFLRPFRGPATRHLAGYLDWFAARVDGSLGSRVLGSGSRGGSIKGRLANAIA